MTGLRCHRAPAAACRLQLRAAAAQLPYYAALGVSHLYLSPIAVAVPGSTHGYDGIDPARINPELGGARSGLPAAGDAGARMAWA
jgi:(1->4)-alpha-D-glucan 1-alpha-D-glucosylmutase